MSRADRLLSPVRLMAIVSFCVAVGVTATVDNWKNSVQPQEAAAVSSSSAREGRPPLRVDETDAEAAIVLSTTASPSSLASTGVAFVDRSWEEPHWSIAIHGTPFCMAGSAAPVASCRYCGRTLRPDGRYSGEVDLYVPDRDHGGPALTWNGCIDCLRDVILRDRGRTR